MKSKSKQITVKKHNIPVLSPDDYIFLVQNNFLNKCFPGATGSYIDDCITPHASEDNIMLFKILDAHVDDLKNLDSCGFTLGEIEAFESIVENLKYRMTV